MIRWLREVMPPTWAVLLTVLWGICQDVLYFWAVHNHESAFDTAADRGVFVGPMAMFMVFYAIFRVRLFHPGLHTSYMNWLMGTPWTSRKLLPLGPLHLVPQDVLLVAAAVGLSWPACGMKSLALAEAFLAAYLLMICLVHFLTGQKAWAYAVAAGLGLMGFFAFSPLFLAAAGATYVCALLGLRASLAEFPWDDQPHYQGLQRLFKAMGPSKYKMMLGWPIDRLSPQVGASVHNPFTLSDTIVIGLLAGWWFFVAASQLGGHPAQLDGMTRLWSFFLFYAVNVRIVIYCQGYMPPLSLWGRITLGRLVIPGYDQVFVAPFLALAAAYVSVNELPFWMGIPNLLALPIGVTVTWWILFGMGPGLKSWQLTGNHRTVKGLIINQGLSSR